MEVYDFGLRLKELRVSRNLSQEEVAKRLNLTRSTISAYESNVKSPPKDTIRSFAYLYNVSADYLLGIENRKALYLDGFTEEQQSIIEDFLDKMRPQLKKADE